MKGGDLPIYIVILWGCMGSVFINCSRIPNWDFPWIGENSGDDWSLKCGFGFSGSHPIQMFCKLDMTVKCKALCRKIIMRFR